MTEISNSKKKVFNVKDSGTSLSTKIPAAKRQTILVVDDDEMMREVVTGVLGLSHHVLVAKDGAEAQEILLESKPDLIISDILMPRTDGFQLLKTIKQDQRLKDIPFIMITGQNYPSTRIRSLDAGANDVLTKPFDSKELLVRVKNLLKIHKQEIQLKRLNEELQLKVGEQVKTIIKNERLTRFFPRKLVKWILSSENELELFSEKKLMTIFFSDLTGYSELGEKSPPEVMRNVLNEYFTEMVNIVEKFEGTLDKFIGDGLMVFFGAPEPMDEKEQSVRAVSMAVEMQKKMKDLTDKWTRQGINHHIKVRMGVHQDDVMVGNFGSKQLMEYTVIGSGVNLANRLESYCEPEKILVSARVLQHCEGMFAFQKVVMQRIRGFERLVPVSELDPGF